MIQPRLLWRMFIAFLCLIILDFMWLSIMFNRLYRPVYMSIQKRVIVRTWSAILVWLLLAVLVATQRHMNPRASVLHGLLLGCIVYGTYNFTNHATLYKYPLRLAAIDTIWGGFAIAIASLVVNYFH